MNGAASQASRVGATSAGSQQIGAGWGRCHLRAAHAHAVMASLLALLTLLLLPLQLHAQNATAIGTASVLVPDAPVTVGDIVALTVEVRHPSGTVAIVPSLETDWGDFEVRSQGAVTVEQQGDTLISRQIIEVTLFAPGGFQTPPLAIALTDGGGNTVEVVAPSVALSVTSVLTDADSEPRDIKGQADIAGAFPTTAVVGAVAALALIAFGVWWYARRSDIGRLLARTPLQRVFDELDAIEREGYPARAEYKQLYLAVSDVVRSFAQKQLGLPLHERTTGEMRQLMRQARVQPETARQLINLFNECDLVKFSQVTPTPESAADLFVEAKSLVTLLATGANPASTSAPVAAEPLVHG